MIEEFLLSIGYTVFVFFNFFLALFWPALQRERKRRGPPPHPALQWARLVLVAPETMTAYSCDFCGAHMGFVRPGLQPFLREHPSCSEFRQARKDTVCVGVFVGADDVVLRRSILEMDPSAEVELTLERHAPLVVSYRAKVRRRSLIKSAHKE